jgi:hypothetical protein
MESSMVDSFSPPANELPEAGGETRKSIPKHLHDMTWKSMKVLMYG